MKTKDKVLQIINKHGQISVHEIALELKISRQYIHKVLLDLEDEKLIKKVGIPPKVFYSLQEESIMKSDSVVSYEDEVFLQRHFIAINPLGEKLEGFEAMKYWCERQSLPLEKTISEFIQTKDKYLVYSNENGLIDGMEKLKNTNGIGQIGVDQLFYLDFYVIERFGKTRLGTLMHYAKQGQNKSLMKIIVTEIRQRVLSLMQNTEVNAVVFVPPTISRKVQIIDYLEKHLDINLPVIKVDKIKTKIIVPQKALSKIFERVANAKNTFVIPNQQHYDHVLIIDDAIGSGATINEIALKIKEKNIATKITGLAVTGSFKGFDVISEI
ncbi:MAG: HTH domain-containing protein [Saprospiraceae bacterium]|nr:HTH domain-containing protein [Saprospiraceae bacterium]